MLFSAKAPGGAGEPGLAMGTLSQQRSTWPGRIGSSEWSGYHDDAVQIR